MPTFKAVSRNEAMMQTATGKKGQLLRQYAGFIEQVPEGEAGSLSPEEGESVAAVRRRLGAAAKLLGKKLTMKRVDNAVLFWG